VLTRFHQIIFVFPACDKPEVRKFYL